MRLYVIAMEDEAKDIIKNAHLIHDKPFKLYRNKKNKNLIAITGIGKVNAASTLTAVINTYDINEIVNIGFAGATNQYRIGDVVVINDTAYHDFDLTIFGYEKGQVPSMPAFFNRTLLFEIFDDNKTAKLFTGDYFMEDSLEDNFISDMEGASFHHVAHIYNIPIVSIKVISDIIGEEQQKDVYEDFEKMGSKYIFDIFNSLEVE